MGIFDIDYGKLIVQLKPVRLRKAKIKAFTKVLVSPIVVLYNDFKSFRLEVLYELNHNGQICRLEGMLNDKFDNSLRRIYIVDAPIVLPLFIHRRAEAKPVYLRRRSEATPKYIRRNAELTKGGAFIVKVPVSLVFDTSMMKALIDKYKLAGKAYKIQTF